LEQGQTDRRQAASPTEARLVDPNQAANRGGDLAMFNLAIDSKPEDATSSA